jgi:hypothetical protein
LARWTAKPNIVDANLVDQARVSHKRGHGRLRSAENIRAESSVSGPIRTTISK